MSENGSLAGKRVLITGGLGFIGSSIAHKALQEGADITLFDACLEPYGWNYANIAEIKNDVHFVKGDIRDYDTLKKYVIDKDLVFHMAAQVGREISMTYPELDIGINCNGTLNLARICAQAGHEIKVVYAGTRGQIGEPNYLPVDESHPTNPTDVYGANKLAAEKYLFLYGKAYGFPVTALRLNNVYGPRCQMRKNFYGILNWFLKNAMCEEDITVYGSGEQTRDYVYIDDVVEAFLLAARSSRANGEYYFVGSGEETIFLDMVRTIIQVVGKGRYVHVPFPPEREKIDIRRFVVSFGKIWQQIRWRPTIKLEDGIQRTHNFYKERLSEYLDN